MDWQKLIVWLLITAWVIVFWGVIIYYALEAINNMTFSPQW